MNDKTATAGTRRASTPGLSRRDLLGRAPAACGMAAMLGLSGSRAHALGGGGAQAQDTDDGFPRQDLDAVEEVVTYSHFHLERVGEIVSARPELAKASWDWGFGDWETAIGAASHKGRLDIAEVLMKHGARPTIFTFAMAGDLAVVRAMIEAHPGIQRIHGPHGFTLMYHARAGGSRAESVVRYLEEAGDADLAGVDLEIPEDEKVRIVGTYRYGPGSLCTIDVLEQRGELRIRRTERVARRLVRVGAFEYHPSGATSVAVRFDPIGRVARMVTIGEGPGSIVGARQ